jgi:porphobilinogen synthase
MLKRPRRNRKSAAIRSLVEETILRPSDLVAPYFIVEGKNRREELDTLPGIERLSPDELLKDIEKLHKKGLAGVALFPVLPSERKDTEGSAAFDPHGILVQTVRLLKRELPTLCIFTDVALDPFTSHGHDGVIRQGDVDNDETIRLLEKMAILHAESGSDFVAPSDMMDGRVAAIRRALDAQGFTHTGILAYTAKYASSLYAPFRDVLGSHLQFGDKKSYQMNPANSREALREARLDEEEGADIIMVKPALFYLDIICNLRKAIDLPIAAYHVSGEYAMVMAAHEKGFVDADRVFCESLISIKRAGADFILSYAASRILNSF